MFYLFFLCFALLGLGKRALPAYLPYDSHLERKLDIINSTIPIPTSNKPWPSPPWEAPISGLPKGMLYFSRYGAKGNERNRRELLEDLDQMYMDVASVSYPHHAYLIADIERGDLHVIPIEDHPPYMWELADALFELEQVIKTYEPMELCGEIHLSREGSPRPKVVPVADFVIKFTTIQLRSER